MNEVSPNWKRRTIVFLISQSVTLFGSTLVQMAIVWYVTLLTSSGTWVSFLTVCAYLPQFFMSFIGGVWADRYSRKTLIIAADAVIAVVTFILFLAMPYLGDSGPLLYFILGVSILRSLAAGIQTPAVNAVIPSLVPEEELMRFNGINATMQSIVQFAAPAAAGAILTFSSLRSSLMIDIATAAVGIGLIAVIAIPVSERLQAHTDVLSEMKEGIKYAFGDKFIGRLLASFGIFIFLCVPAGFLANLYVSRTFGDTYWYLTALELVGFAGMALGGLVIGIWGGFKKRVKTLLIGMTAFGALAVAMGLSRSFILYLALMLIYGIALTMVQTSTTTLLQERTVPEMQGRVFGLFGSIYSLFLPIGMGVFGPLADMVPLRAIIIGSGAALIVMAAVCRGDKNFYQ